MKRVRWVALVMVLVSLWAVSPLAVFAQGGDEIELVEAVSEDETLTVGIPAEWFVTPIEEYPFPNVMVVNSEEGVDRFLADEDMVEGDQFLMIMVVPVDFLVFLGYPVPEGATVLEMTASFAEGFVSSEEETESMETYLDTVEEVELSDEVTGAYVAIKDEEADGAIIGVDLGENALGVVIVAAYSGEFDDDLADLSRQIAATMVFTGSADDIMGALMGTGMDTETSTAELDGAALVAERCSVCHDTTRIDRADKDEAGWTATVDRMIGNGAQLTDAEREAVIAYLVETH